MKEKYMGKFYYRLLVENGKKKIVFLNRSLTDQELNTINDLNNLMLNVLKLVTIHNVMADSFFKLKKLKFQRLQKFNDTDQLNELVINFVSNTKLFIDYLDERWVKQYTPDFYKKWKKQCSEFYDESESYRLCYHLRNFVQHSGSLPIAKVEQKINSNHELETNYLLNIEAFKKFRKEFKKVKISDDYWQKNNNVSFMKHAIKYIKCLEILYLLAGQEYMKEKENTFSQIFNSFKKSDLKYQIYWSYISPEKARSYMKQNKFTIHPMCTLPSLIQFYKMLSKEGLIKIDKIISKKYIF